MEAMQATIDDETAAQLDRDRARYGVACMVVRSDGRIERVPPVDPHLMLDIPAELERLSRKHLATGEKLRSLHESPAPSSTLSGLKSPLLCPCGGLRSWSALRRQWECQRWNCASPHRAVTLEFEVWQAGRR